MKIDQSGSGKQASIVISFDENPSNEYIKNLQERLNMSLEGYEVIANTGAAPTITIHAIDGDLIGKTISDNKWLSIYDAIVQAADPKIMDQTTKDMSWNTIESSMVRNILRDNLKKLEYMISKLTDKKQIESIQNRVKRISEVTMDEIKEIIVSKSNHRIKRIRTVKNKNTEGKYITYQPKNNVKVKSKTDNIDNRTKTYIDYLDGTEIYKTKIITENDNNTKTIKEVYKSSYRIKNIKGIEYNPRFEREYTIKLDEEERYITKMELW